MTLGEKIKELRNENSMTLLELSKKLDVSVQTLSRYENGVINMSANQVNKISNVFKVSPSYLMGWDEDDKNKKNGVKIPVLGKVQAGIPINANEYIIDYEEIPEELAKKGDFFALQIKGSSMEPRIIENDVVIVQKQNFVNNGDVGIILINGDEATCKKIIFQQNGISLISFNELYHPMFFSKEEVQSLPVEIIGKVVELRGKF